MPRGYFYPRPPRGGRLICSISFCRVGIFLSTPSARRATVPCMVFFVPLIFLSTPSARRATGAGLRKSSDTPYFYPRPPRGGRPCGAGATLLAFLFLSTPSARRATLKDNSKTDILSNFYPRPPRGGRPDCNVDVVRIAGFLSTPSARRATSVFQPVAGIEKISIHALREEGDSEAWNHAESAANFYPRPPRGGRRPAFNGAGKADVFLSTPCAMRATS